jgi:hypothetical protein
MVKKRQLHTFIPRHQVFMEGAGILIPPQVQWYVDYRIFNVVTGATIAATDETAIGLLPVRHSRTS